MNPDEANLISGSGRRPRREKLTDLKVAQLPKKAKRYTVVDPEMGGHYVRVMPEAANVFCAVARNPDGKLVWATLGNAGVLNIREARDKAREAIKRIKEGKPPFPPPEKLDSFETVARDWLTRYVEKNKLRTNDDIGRLLNKYILPAWKKRSFIDIRRGDVSKLLDQIEDEHGARQADICLAIIRKIMNWHASRTNDYTSPIVKGMGRYNPQEHKRKRVLGRDNDRKTNDEEIRVFWACADGMGTFGALVKVLLLTGQRRSKVVAMRWSDLDDGVWHIPAEHREKSNAELLRLPPIALDVIAAQPKIVGNPYVFAAAVGKGPFNSFSQHKDELDAKMRERLPNMERWVLHDLRRTARSLMSRAGVPSEHAERTLGHAIKGVEGVYDRHRYDEEKADALDRLANLIETIVNTPADAELEYPAAGRLAGRPGDLQTR